MVVLRPRLKYVRLIYSGIGIALGFVLPLPPWLLFGISILWFLILGWPQFRYLPFHNWHVSLVLTGKLTEYLLKKHPFTLASLGLALVSQPVAGTVWIAGLFLLAKYGKRRWESVVWPLCTGHPSSECPLQYWFRPSGLGDVFRLTDVWSDYIRSGLTPPVKILCNRHAVETIRLLVGDDHVEAWEDFKWLKAIKSGARIIDLRQTMELDNEHSCAHVFALHLCLPKPEGYLVFPQNVRKRKRLDHPEMVWILLCCESGHVSRTLSLQAQISLIRFLLSHYLNLGIIISDRKKSRITVHHDRLIDFSGKLPLDELLSMMNTVDGIITTDNGSLHMGLALEKPIFAYFNTMPAWKVLPAKARGLTYVEYNGACAPCFIHSKPCPVTIHHDFPCMQNFPQDATKSWLEATFTPRLIRAIEDSGA